LLFVLKALLQGDDIDGLLFIKHLHERLKEGLVAQIVKNQMARLELFDALAQAIIGGKQDTAQHALLRFD
jgi:hypothetical protein